MLFNSFAFALFFPIVLILYWVLSHRWQNRMLLVASYIFYGYWDWRFLSLIAISTVIDYVVSIKIGQEQNRTDDGAPRRRKLWLIASVCASLGLLGFFKYYNFFARSMADMLGTFGLNPDWFYLDIVLPVGISFYTFQTMSYVIDVYRGVMPPAKSLLDFALYVSYFPQLVAGPIERAKALLPSIVNKRVFNKVQFHEGLHLILLGLFKKVFVADNLGPAVDHLFKLTDPTWFQVLVGGWGFAIQVYCDFSGYSDIARGCAKCMGIELMVNFRHPYVAGNPVERWQRWHISLSTWLRDYLYIPLGGSRKGTFNTYRNLGLTMLLGGLWHGAGWNFVLWGTWEGLMLIVHRLCSPFMESLQFFKNHFPAIVRRLFRMFLMFQLVSLGLIIFRGHSIPHIGRMLGSIFSLRGVADASLLWPLVYYALPLTLYEIIQYRLSQDEWSRIARIPVWIRTIVYALFVYLIAFYGAAAQSFIYFQF